MNSAESFLGPVTIKPGFGYWRTTVLPMGGDFHRAANAMALSEVQIIQRYTNGEPRLFTGKHGKESIAVNAECCDF